MTAAFDPTLISALKSAKSITILTGAGVSAESGVPTFRDAQTGLWQKFDAHELATADAFLRDPALVWGWYEWRRSKVLAACPNPGHLAIAELARKVPRLSLFTQNIDDLHERAGSVDVRHLHGSLNHPRCFKCGAPFLFSTGVLEEPEVGRRLSPPVCQRCGGAIRPGVVWFNERLPEDVIETAIDSARMCDLFLLVGTSGVVYPAAYLPIVARESGGRVIQVNLQKTALDEVCTWNVRGPSGQILPKLASIALSCL